MTWWQTANGYVNGGAVEALTVRENSPSGSGVWRIWAAQAGVTTAGVSLLGDYDSEEAAQVAVAKLCQGIDPRTVTGGA